MRVAGVVAVLAAVMVASSATAATELHAAIVKPTYVTSIGGGLTGHAEIYPGGVDVDANGIVYVADTGNDDVKAYYPNGAVDWTRGTRGAKALGNFDNPRDIAYLNGKLYVADLGNKRVQVLDAATGDPLEAWPTVFPSPIGISAGVDGSGNPIILVTQDVKNQVTAFKPDGTPTGEHFGSGTAGSGNGQLNAPRDAATDSAGNVYVADYANDRIAKFSPSGAWIKSWGSSGGHDGEFRRPYGVAVDVDNKIYVADSTNHRVQIFDSNGTHIANYGTAPDPQQPIADGQFAMLRRVAVAPGVSHPDIYMADLWGYRVSQVSQSAGSPPTFTYDRTFGNVPPADGAFNEPSGLTFGNGHLYVADSVNQRMDFFNPTTYAYQGKWGERGWGADSLGFNWPRDITYMAATNTVWVADTKNGRLVEFNTDGTPTGRTYGTLGGGAGQLNRPYAVDATGSALIVADSTNNRVERIDTSAPMPTLPAWSTTLPNGNPQDVTIDGSTVLVTDTRNNRLVRLNADTGAQIGGYLGVGNLHSPEGVAVDGNGNIWVGDRAYNRVVELNSSGGFVQFLGKLGTGPGQFNHPTHVVVQGNLLYVCDVWNDRIQVFNLSPAAGSKTDTFTGSVNASGTASVKKTFTVTDTSAPIQAELDWQTTSANLNLFLMPPGSSTAVAQATSKTNNPETLSFQPTVTGTYTLRVKAITGSSAFTLTATHD
jgi:DNA-binding beta-propeller fold protein YncE